MQTQLPEMLGEIMSAKIKNGRPPKGLGKPHTIRLPVEQDDWARTFSNARGWTFAYTIREGLKALKKQQVQLH